MHYGIDSALKLQGFQIFGCEFVEWYLFLSQKKSYFVCIFWVWSWNSILWISLLCLAHMLTPSFLRTHPSVLNQMVIVQWVWPPYHVANHFSFCVCIHSSLAPSSWQMFIVIPYHLVKYSNELNILDFRLHNLFLHHCCTDDFSWERNKYDFPTLHFENWNLDFLQ